MVKLQIHQLVHVVQHQHVAIQLHDALIFKQGERPQLAPAVVEAGVVAVFLVDGREQVRDVSFGYTACVQRVVAFLGEFAGVQGYEGVFGADFLEGVV